IVALPGTTDVGARACEGCPPIDIPVDGQPGLVVLVFREDELRGQHVGVRRVLLERNAGIRVRAGAGCLARLLAPIGGRDELIDRALDMRRNVGRLRAVVRAAACRKLAREPISIELYFGELGTGYLEQADRLVSVLAVRRDVLAVLRQRAFRGGGSLARI